MVEPHGLLSAYPRKNFGPQLSGAALKADTSDEVSSGKITVVGVLPGAAERQAKSQTHVFMLQKKRG